MKKIYAILAVAAVAACTAFAVSSFASRDPFFEANVEALTGRESGYWSEDPCAEESNSCLFFCPNPECNVMSEVPDQKGPANVNNIYGKCTVCGYEKHAL